MQRYEAAKKADEEKLQKQKRKQEKKEAKARQKVEAELNTRIKKAASESQLIPAKQRKLSYKEYWAQKTQIHLENKERYDQLMREQLADPNGLIVFPGTIKTTLVAIEELSEIEA